LPELFDKYHIENLLDLGCGDFNWMSHVALKLNKYLGIDVVDNIIESNMMEYATDGIQFKCQDITTVINEFLDDYDAVIIRDVLVHFSFKDIQTILNNIFQSNIKYLFTTSFLAETSNYDIHTGSWRRLNFMLPPFEFCPPIETIISYSEPYNINAYRYFDKTLSMWKVEDIKK